MLVKWKIVVFLAHFCALCFGEKGWLQYSYNSELEGFIKLHTEPADWHSARLKCHMEGAFLASPWFAEFASVISKLQTGSPQLAVLFSGVHKTFAEGALNNVAGKLAISTHPSELMKIERCGVFLADGSTGEVNCDESLPFVCYRPASDPELDIYTESETEPEYPNTTENIPESSEYTIPTEYFTESTEDLEFRFHTEPALSLTLTPGCGEINLGYEFAEQTGHCYKFHTQAVETWYDAKAACEAEGAHLAIVNSDVEAQVLMRLFEKYPAKKIHGAIYTDTAAIGYYSNENNNWVTIDGETLQEAGYEKWRPEAPFRSAKLGFICRDGLLYGYVNDIRYVPFICEKPRKMKTEQIFEQETTALNYSELETAYTYESMTTEPNYNELETADISEPMTTDQNYDDLETADTSEPMSTEPNYDELETADTSEPMSTEPNYDELETEKTPNHEQNTFNEKLLTQKSLIYCPFSGYEFSELTKRCYKFHAQAVNTWYDAKAACEEEGAYLAIVNSEVEAQVLKKLFEKYPAEKIYGAPYTDTAAIGYYRNMYNDWVTINGESLEEAGYEAWRPDAPHPWAKLGFFYRDGLLYGYVPAIRDVPFICEKETFEEYVKTTEKRLAQITENETVQATEKNDGTTTEEEPKQVIKENYGPTSEEETVQATEKNYEPTTEEETVQVTEENYGQTIEDETILATEENYGSTTEEEPVPEEKVAEITEHIPTKTTQKGLEQTSPKQFVSLHELVGYDEFELSYFDDEESYGY